MSLLAIDIGSSSVKAAVLSGRRTLALARVPFKTQYVDDLSPRAEVKLSAIEHAVRTAITNVGDAARHVDRIVHATMAPSWLALDKAGRALTGVVTHQDRRSVDQAAAIERSVGKARHLKLAGNRPFPGGISSTTFAWHLAHQRDVMKRAVLVGHLGTWLCYALAGVRTMDLSNAGFTGLMDLRTCNWNADLIDAIGAEKLTLPDIVPSDAVVGAVTPAAARRFGLSAGTPVLAGCIDGSAAMLAARAGRGAAVGQLVNVCGSTDVLALCSTSAQPHPELLTRPLGVGGKWLNVGTIAAAGSAIEWARRTFYSEMSEPAFHAHVRRVADKRPASSTRLKFVGGLAGSRTAMEVARASVEGLTLSTTRDDLLAGLLAQLADESRERLTKLALLGVPMRREVFVTGGGGALMSGLSRRHWPAGFTFRARSEATLLGLARLAGE